MAENGQIASGIRGKALDMGFSACGFAPVARLSEWESFYDQWIADGKHGSLDYLAKNRALRLNPASLLPGAKTVISLAASYYYPTAGNDTGDNLICRYARGKDYHKVLKSRCKKLLAWIHATYGPVSGRIFVDSGVVLEKEWARRAGLGWIGKHGLLIIPGKGSWFLLCEILTDLEVEEENTLVDDRCGTCTRCMEACPTGALASAGRLDLRSCIAYLTIESKAEIPESLKGKWDHTIYGCDICQEACPWNAAPEISRMAEFFPVVRMDRKAAESLRSLDSKAFFEKYGGTPLKRAGLSGLVRNYNCIT